MNNMIKTFFAVILISGFTACKGSGSKSVGNSQDTESVNKAGGPQIADTATISQIKKDSAVRRTDTTGKGNADPSGRPTNK